MGQCKNVSSHIMPINESPKIIFTRYLYVKDEVMLTLIMSILGKHESSVFWAYELYYSGFENELFNLLWKIYFDFYYTLNPSFYDYFIKKQIVLKYILFFKPSKYIINVKTNQFIY